MENKNTDKLKSVSGYLGGSYIIVNLAVHFFPDLKDVQAELLALTNAILVFSKMVIGKWLNDKN